MICRSALHGPCRGRGLESRSKRSLTSASPEYAGKSARSPGRAQAGKIRFATRVDDTQLDPAAVVAFELRADPEDRAARRDGALEMAQEAVRAVNGQIVLRAHIPRWR